MTKSIDQHEGNKYLRTIYSAKTAESIQVDVYAVLKAFNVTCPARAHAIKKLLCCGSRGKGNELQDLLGVEAAVSRAIELQRLEDYKEKNKPTITEKIIAEIGTEKLKAFDDAEEYDLPLPKGHCD